MNEGDESKGAETNGGMMNVGWKGINTIEIWIEKSSEPKWFQGSDSFRREVDSSSRFHQMIQFTEGHIGHHPVHQISLVADVGDI